MNKILACVLAMVLHTTFLNAQNFHIEKSEEFDEPALGWHKLLQMKNGNTVYFHGSSKEPLEIAVYDKNRKKTAEKSITSDKWDMGKVLGLYEINGEAVVFIEAHDDLNTLYRVRINGLDGTMVKEDGLGHSVDGKGVTTIEKDPASGSYVVVFASQDQYRNLGKNEVKVCHFDGNHKKLSEADFKCPAGFKQLLFSSAAVDGDKAVYVLISGTRGISRTDENWKLFLYKLTAGETSFKSSPLSNNLSFHKLESILLYNHTDNLLQLYTLSLSDSKVKLGGRTVNTYAPMITYIEPDSLKMVARIPVAAAKVTQYAHDHIDKDYEYSGLPRQMIINKDNTTTLLMEEMREVGEQTFLGDIGVEDLSARGVETKGYTVRKNQDIVQVTGLSHVQDRSKGTSDGASPFYHSYDYINTGKGRYVVFNDVRENFGKDEDVRNPKTMLRISGADAFCVKLNENGLEKSFLFGEPDKTSSGAFCYMSSSCLNRETNTYAVIVIERDGRKKVARVAWVGFE